MRDKRNPAGSYELCAVYPNSNLGLNICICYGEEAEEQYQSSSYMILDQPHHHVSPMQTRAHRLVVVQCSE